jgi:hypothetical protein
MVFGFISHIMDVKIPCTLIVAVYKHRHVEITHKIPVCGHFLSELSSAENCTIYIKTAWQDMILNLFQFTKITVRDTY